MITFFRRPVAFPTHGIGEKCLLVGKGLGFLGGRSCLRRWTGQMLASIYCTLSMPLLAYAPETKHEKIVLHQRGGAPHVLVVGSRPAVCRACAKKRCRRQDHNNV